MYKIDIQKYLPYFKDVKVEYKYTKDDNGQGVIVCLRYKENKLEKAKKYTHKAFTDNIINLEQIRNDMIVKIFEDYVELINHGKIQKPKTFLQKIFDEIFTKT